MPIQVANTIWKYSFLNNIIDIDSLIYYVDFSDYIYSIGCLRIDNSFLKMLLIMSHLVNRPWREQCQSRIFIYYITEHESTSYTFMFLLLR